MKLLVTGGAGYVGSVCAAHLVDHGHEVTVLDDLSTGHQDAVPDGARFVQADLGDAADELLAEGFDGYQTKPITLTFALIGLCLHVDYGFSGGQVQRAHMALARHRRGWPSFQLPVDRGVLTVADVVVRPEGQARDEAIDRWCASVWTAYKETHPAVVALLREHGVL